MSNIVTIKTDFHTHLLPDIDCSGKPELSVRLLKEMKSAGVQNVVLTPHFYPQYNNNVEDFLASRDHHIAKLMKKAFDEGISDMDIIPAVEVLLCPGLENLEGLEKLCIGKTNNVLIEMPDTPWSDDLLSSLEKIQKKLGLNVIIAHADRYEKKYATLLISKGFKIQVNADSTVSFLMKRTVLDWVKKGYVYALGSDHHVHSNQKSCIYKEFPKASSIIAKYSDEINERSLKLIGK